jgi:carbonic anhydrase
MCRDHAVLSSSRRHMMVGAGALLAASAVSPALVHAADDKPAPNDISPEEALARLKEGNAHYLAGEFKERDFEVDRAARAQSQAPIAAVLSCADSRVPPEIIFDQGPGDLFVMRDAGNVVSTYGLASMEFATKVLAVPLIVVLGHSGCGAVAAALQASTGREELPGHLPELVKSIEPAIITAHGKHPSDFLAATIEENVRLGMKRLKTQSEIIGDAVASGKVGIKGGVYQLATGKIDLV